MKRTPLALTAVLLPAAAFAQTDAEIRQILADRIEIARQSVGMVVGVIGNLDQNDKRPLNGDTVF